MVMFQAGRSRRSKVDTWENAAGVENDAENSQRGHGSLLRECKTSYLTLDQWSLNSGGHNCGSLLSLQMSMLSDTPPSK